MTSTYVNNLRLNEMGTGDQSGSWGTVTNTNLELIGEALGYGTEAITTNADTHATTVADGSTDPGRAMFIKYTGTLDSACTITIGPDTLKRLHIIENATSGSQNILIKQGSGGGASVTIPNGHTKIVYLDGGGSGAIVTDATTDLNINTTLYIKNPGTGDDSTAHLYLQTAETDIAINDVIGKINFQAPDEGTGTDANLVAAAIAAISEGDFSSSSNATKLSFMTGSSEAAAEKASLSSGGDLTVSGDVNVGDDVSLTSDSSVINMGAGNDVTLTHDGTTGVTIAANPITIDSGGNLNLDAHTGIWIFKDAGSEMLRFTEGNSGDVTIKLATDAKDLVFTDNGDATNMKILDAAAGINVPGEVQTTKIAYTDGDDAITIADGGGVTLSAGLDCGDNNITNVGSIALDSIASDAGTGTAITMSAGLVGNTETASKTGSVAPDMSQYTNFVWTLTGNLTLTDPGDEAAGQGGIFVFIQDGTGSRTLSHAANEYFTAGGSAITLSTAASAIDVVPYFVQADGKIHLGAVQKAFADA